MHCKYYEYSYHYCNYPFVKRIVEGGFLQSLGESSLVSSSRMEFDDLSQGSASHLELKPQAPGFKWWLVFKGWLNFISTYFYTNYIAIFSKYFLNFYFGITVNPWTLWFWMAIEWNVQHNLNFWKQLNIN